MSSKHTTIPILLAGCICASVLFVVSKKPKAVVPEPPHAESFEAYLKVPRDIELCFDSLLAWQSGDTNQFHRIISEKEYDSNLRNAVQRAIRQGKDGEVLRFINLVLNHWMVTESCHCRSYEWPDREADREAWEFLSRIYANRQQHPYSTGDADGDAMLNRILERTRSHVEAAPIDRGVSVDEWSPPEMPSNGVAKIVGWAHSDYDWRMAYWLAQAHARYRLSDCKRSLKHLPQGMWSYVPKEFTIENVRYAEMHQTHSFFGYSFPQQPQLDDSRYVVFMHYRSKEKPLDATNFIFALYVNLNTGAVGFSPATPNNLHGVDGKMSFPLLSPDTAKVQQAFAEKFISSENLRSEDVTP